MLSLHSHHIADVYVWVDDLLPKQAKDLSKDGRPQLLSDSETITVLVWNTFMLHQKNIKDIHRFMRIYLKNEFPSIPKYNTFFEHCHKVTPLMFGILKLLLERKSPIIFMDSTMVPVCKLKRAGAHKVAKKLANIRSGITDSNGFVE